MPDQASQATSRPRDHRRLRRQRLALLVGLALLLLATPAMVVVALVSEADWAVVAALATFTIGLVVVGGVLTPGRSSFRGGTKIWQNDGLPGGGAGF